MKSALLIPLLVLFQYSCAQVARPNPAMNDTLPIPPNTVRVKATILSFNETEVTLQIATVIGTGQGIINPLSEGQKVTVQLRDGNKKLKKGKNIIADLKEKLGVDASQSLYVLLQLKE